MQYRPLGRSGLLVSTLTLGTMTFGGRGAFAKTGDTDAKGAARLLDMCLDAGVNFLDTADIYSTGLSEEICGDILGGGDRRARTLVATKARFRMGPGPNQVGLSRHHLIEACHASLKRLKIGHIDLYQLHEWDGITPIEEMLEALDTLVRHGHVRYIGVSNFSGWHIMKMLGLQERAHTIRPVCQQIHYTLQAREAEYELIPISLDQGLAIMVWSPLAGGLLSGKFRRGVEGPAGARALSDWGEPPVRDQDKLYDIIDVLVRLADARGISAAQFALAWLLGRPGVTSLVVGARNETQLADNLLAADLTLTTEERAALDAVSLTPLPYPYWHQARTAKDRLGPADLSLIGPHLAS